jgi:hypothetical protein
VLRPEPRSNRLAGSGTVGDPGPGPVVVVGVPQIDTWEIDPWFTKKPLRVICSMPFHEPRLNRYWFGLWLPSFTIR